ncbi:MAG: DNA-3-methyladenine glycosylase family protein [Hyphomonas sp.]
MTAPSAEALRRGCKALAKVDPALAKAYEQLGSPNWRSGVPEYATLARMVAYQQITTKAAAKIWERVEAEFGTVTPEAVLSAGTETLRGCGLSRPKVSHMNTIAEAIVTGALNLDRVCTAELVDARKELVAVRGIGPWTAELFLLYSVGAMDAFPPGDIGIMEAHKRLSGSETRMEIKAFTAFAERWRPYRGVAAHLLWDWLNDQRARDAVAPK